MKRGWVQRTALVAAIALLAGLSCDEFDLPTEIPAPAEPGTLLIRVSAGSGTAFVFTLTGPAPSSIDPASSATHVYQTMHDGQQWIIALGRPGNGELVQLTVPDIHQTYHVQLLEAAGSDDALLGLGDQTLTVGP